MTTEAAGRRGHPPQPREPAASAARARACATVKRQAVERTAYLSGESHGVSRSVRLLLAGRQNAYAVNRDVPAPTPPDYSAGEGLLEWRPAFLDSDGIVMRPGRAWVCRKGHVMPKKSSGSRRHARFRARNGAKFTSALYGCSPNRPEAEADAFKTYLTVFDADSMRLAGIASQVAGVVRAQQQVADTVGSYRQARQELTGSAELVASSGIVRAQQQVGDTVRSFVDAQRELTTLPPWL